MLLFKATDSRSEHCLRETDIYPTIKASFPYVMGPIAGHRDQKSSLLVSVLTHW